MKHLPLLAVLTLLYLSPIACGKNISPAPAAPSTGNGSSLATDGTNWIFSTLGAAFSERYAQNSVVFNGKMWVIAGAANSLQSDSWYSSDGTNWTQAATVASGGATFSPSRTFFTSLVFNNKIWILAGDGPGNVRQDDTWSSSDGAHWTQSAPVSSGSATFTSRSTHSSVVFDNGTGPKMWILGGFDGTNALSDVWSSADGAHWAQAVPNASPNSFEPVRLGHSSVVFNAGFGNAMWVLGGQSGTTILNDVWYSLDGSQWNQAVTNGSPNSFPPRFGQTSLVFDNAMWVIGGYNNAVPFNDVWYSTDGAHWNQAAIQESFSPRFLHSSVVFNNSMWVIAGNNGSVTYLNDIWHSP
jgi:hypothetical protein